MLFEKTSLEGVLVINLEPIKDDRGMFTRSFCKKEFEQEDLRATYVQSNVSFNKKKSTLRGMHYQSVPYSEIKIVRCTRGKIFDVVIDLRKDSSTYLKWIGLELNQDNHKSIYIPEGFAHGFQTLEENCEVLYHMSEYYHPECANTVRWNDPTFNIKWPLGSPILSKKDANCENYKT